MAKYTVTLKIEEHYEFEAISEEDAIRIAKISTEATDIKSAKAKLIK